MNIPLPLEGPYRRAVALVWWHWLAICALAGVLAS